MKFLLCGYYGYRNAGDELLLHATVRLLRRAHPDAEICVLSNDPAATAAAYGVRAVHRYNPFALIRRIMHADRVIIGGGGLLQDFTGPLTLHYYLLVAFAGICLGVPTCWHAVGANPLRAVNAFVASRILRCCDLITLRDEESRRLVMQWGVAAHKIVITADPVFSLMEPPMPPHPRPSMLLVLRRHADTMLYASAIEDLSRELSMPVTMLPFQPGHDDAISDAIAQALPEYVKTLSWETLPEVAAHFDRCALVISERFHALVLAAMRGIPAVCVSNDEKLIRFARMAGYPVVRPADHLDAESLKTAARAVWKQRHELRSSLLTLSSAQAHLAAQNPALL